MKSTWLILVLLSGLAGPGLVGPGLLGPGLALAQMPMPDAEHQHDQMGSKPAVPSANLVVTIDGKVTTFSPTDLKAMPQKTLAVKNGHTGADESYTGVGVGDLLAKCGFTGAAGKKMFHSYVRAEGSDGYWVLYSASELEGAVSNDDALIAIALNGKPLEAEGAFKMVASAEKKPARWVRNLAALTVITVD